MRLKQLIAATLVCMLAALATAQEQPRANVVPYDDENDIEKLRYTSSPYYIALDSHWQRSENDSAVEYSRQIEAPKWWKDYSVTLNLRTTHECNVAIGGKTAGSAADSRNINEFSLSPLLKYGKNNTLTVSVLKNPPSNLMETATPTRQPSIDGPAFLVLEPQIHIHDYIVLTSVQHRSNAATLSLSVDIANPTQKGRYYIEAELWDPQGHQFDKMGKWAIFNKRNTLRINLEANYATTQPWTAETPNLYTLVLRLRNEEMQLVEVLGTRFGFRTVEIADGLLQINGQPITIKGATYAAANSDGDYSQTQVRQDLMLLKRNGFNAVRTSYYSPANWQFYELCDQLGLYVVCDANLSPLSTKTKAVATDRDFSHHFVQRVTNMYGRYKNHPSIIAWSLGNSTDNGTCMEDAYKNLKGLDRSRPTLFGGAQYSANTDIIAPHNPTAESLRQHLAKPQNRPLIIMSAPGVAEGNCLEFDALWQLVSNNASVQGAFVSNLLPTALKNAESGTVSTHQGLVTATRRNKPQMAALRHLFRPCNISLVNLTADQGEFEVRNITSFSNLSDFTLDYTVCTNLKNRIVEGDLPLNIEPGGMERFKLRLPKQQLSPDEDLFIRFTLRARRATPYYTANTIIDEVEFAIPSTKAARTPLTNLTKQPLTVVYGGTITVSGGSFEATIDSATGTVASLALQGTTVSTLPTLGLASTNNNQQHELHTSAVSYNQPDPYTFCIERLMSSSPGNDIHQTIELTHSGDLLITNEIPKSRKSGLQLTGTYPLPAEYDTASWFGDDRYTCFPSDGGALTSNNKAAISRFADTTDGGQRGNVHWLSLSNATEGLYVDFCDTLFTFGIANGNLSLSIPINTDTTTTVRCHMRHYECYENEPNEFYRIAYPTHTSALTAMPTITSEKAKFDGPMKIFITTAEPGTEVRYTTDGSTPDKKSPLYSDAFSIEASTIVKARAYSPNGSPSFVAEQHFNFDYVQSVTYSRKPNTPYNKDADNLLFDGQKGTVDELTRGWLGFSGNGVEIQFELSKQVEVEYVSIGFAHNPDVWVFAPTSVTLSTSADGINYTQPVEAQISYQPSSADMGPQRVEIDIPLETTTARYIKINIGTLSRIPEWHKAKGLKPWLLADEIQITEKIKQ